LGSCLLLYTEIVKLLVVGLGRSSAHCFRPHTASSSNQNQFSESQDRGLWSRSTFPAHCKTVVEVPMGFRERSHHSSIVGFIKPTSPPPVQIRLPPPIRNSRIRHSALILFYFATVISSGLLLTAFRWLTYGNLIDKRYRDR
jgi:hypothetical protein